MTSNVAGLVLILTAALGSACGSNIASPTSATSAPSATRDLFEGTLSADGTRFFSFTVSDAGTVQVTLVSLTIGASGPTIHAAMGLGVGIPNGADCEVTKAVTTAPGLVSQLTVPMAAGVACTRLFDVGNLTTTVTFAVRILHP